MKTAQSFWRTFPRKSLVVFLLGVFFIFSTIGFAIEIMEIRREPTFRFVLDVLLSGVFAMSYAVTGFVLRKQSWKAFLPIFAVQFVLMNLLGNLFPDLPQPTQMGAADIARLHSRLIPSGTATIFAIGLGYACFVYVSITEGKRYFCVLGFPRHFLSPKFSLF